MTDNQKRTMLHSLFAIEDKITKMRSKLEASGINPDVYLDLDHETTPEEYLHSYLIGVSGNLEGAIEQLSISLTPIRS